MSTLYFAWVGGQATTWSDDYKCTWHEGIATLHGEQVEGGCCTVTIEVINPKIGLLNAGRDRWCWMAYEDDDGLIIFFHGMLVGLPTEINGVAWQLSFIAKPYDYDAQKIAVALTMMTSPNYNAIFIEDSKRLKVVSTGNVTGDPDAVLEGWPKRWAIDKVTNVVSASHILVGEDGTEVLTADDIPAGSVSRHLNEAPLTSITVIGKVNWTQIPTGNVIDFGTKTFNCYNALGIKNDWPKTGQQLAGGWVVNEGIAIDTLGIEGAQVSTTGWRYVNKKQSHSPGEIMDQSFDQAIFPCGGLSFLTAATIQMGTGGTTPYNILPDQYQDPTSDNVPTKNSWTIMLIAKPTVKCSLKLQPDPKMARTETITIKLTANVQPIVSVADPTISTDSITINGSDVGIPINGVAPLPNAAADHFFPTDPGIDAIKYLINVGCNHLKQRGRAAEITAGCSFKRAIGFTMRKNGEIHSPDVDGGVATGKIIKFTFDFSGPAASSSGSVTIGSAIGYGGTVAAQDGTGQYVEDGVLAPGIQVMAGQVVSLGDVGFEPPIYDGVVGELRFPLTKDQVLVSETRTAGTADVQIGQETDPWTHQVKPKIEKVATEIYRLEIKPVNGAFDKTYDLGATPLELPMQINTGASSWA